MTDRPDARPASGSAPPAPRQVASWQHLDGLAQALQLLHMSGVVYCYSELRTPWGMAMPAMPDCLMFHVVTSGRCILHVPGGAPRVLRSGDFALVPHGEGHDLLSAEGSEAAPFFGLQREQHGERFEFLRHGGEGELTTLVCGAVRFDDALARRLVDCLPREIVIDSTSAHGWEWLDPLLRVLADETRSPKAGGEAVITRLADVLVIQAIRAWIAQDPSSHTGWLGAMQDRQVGRALRRVHEEPGVPWSLETLAEAAAMSRSAFAARFSELVGTPPMQYVATWRMNLARQRLQSGGVRIAQLAESLGYESEASFSRAFKRWSGQSPGSVRAGTGNGRARQS
ncbi:MAG: AraC family transcriptional regulator [Burkholderiaceae bacterium]